MLSCHIIDVRRAICYIRQMAQQDGENRQVTMAYARRHSTTRRHERQMLLQYAAYPARYAPRARVLAMPPCPQDTMMLLICERLPRVMMIARCLMLCVMRSARDMMRAMLSSFSIMICHAAVDIADADMMLDAAAWCLPYAAAAMLMILLLMLILRWFFRYAVADAMLLLFCLFRCWCCCFFLIIIWCCWLLLIIFFRCWCFDVYLSIAIIDAFDIVFDHYFFI